MAKKSGFQYYKVNTDRYDDVRIRKLKTAFGTKGISVYDYLLAQIYRYKGCFTVRDENCVFNVAEYFGIKEQLVTEIILYCGEVGLFDAGLLASGNVITSAAIQKRYVELCKLLKRSYVEIPRNILLIPEVIESERLVLYEDWQMNNSGKNGKIQEISGENTEISRKIEKFPENSGENTENSGKIGKIQENSGENQETSRKNEKILEETAFFPEKTPKTPENQEAPLSTTDIQGIYKSKLYIKEKKEPTYVGEKEKKVETDGEVSFDSPASPKEQISLTPTLSTKETTAQKAEKQQALLKERENAFIESLRPYLSLYGKEMLNDFFSYWTEPNKSKTKMRFELEKTWDLDRRLKTWSSRSYPSNRRNYGRNEQQSTFDSMQEAVRAGFNLSDSERQSEDQLR